MKKYLLGLDVGTQGAKAILFSTEGCIIGQSYHAYPINTPQVLFCEQNPADWWDAVCETVREVCTSGAIRNNVVAISLSTQGGTMVCVDEKMNPLRPAILWNDLRSHKECEEFLVQVGSPSYLYQKTGWGLEAGAPVVMMKWIQNNQPEIYRKTAMFLSVPDYISYKMTGIVAVDISNAGVNRFADIQKCMYDDALLSFSGLREDQLAKIVPSGKLIGNLTEMAAEEMGLTTDTVLISGVHDQYAVALGAGANNDGDVLIGSGTSWVVTSIGNEPRFDLGLSQSITAVPGKWGAMWSMSSGGACLEWWRKNLTADITGSLLPYRQVNIEIKKRKAAEDGLFFYPFTGSADEGKFFQRASFVGLDLSHDKFHIARAIMEGVAFQIVWMMEEFRLKPSQEGLVLAGGASKSDVWCQMVADIANMPVQIPETADLACVGAAVLAGVGSGVYNSVEEGYAHLAIPRRVIYPDPVQVEKYSESMKRYIRNAAKLSELYEL